MRKLLKTNLKVAIAKAVGLTHNIPLELWEALNVVGRRALGIDLSKWAPDWVNPQIRVDFAIMRTSWGLNTDKKYINHSNRLMENTDIWGAYHYYSTAVPWKKQVDLFLELVLNNPTGLKYDMVFWDFEAGYNELTTPRSANEFAEAIRYLRMENIPLVGGYTGNNNYSVYLESVLSEDWLNNVPWWLPWPGDSIKNPFSIEINEQPQMGNWRGRWPNRRLVKLKRPLGAWDFWQYSWHGDPVKLGIKDKLQVDMNVYNGSVFDLRKRVKKDPDIPKPPPPTDCDDYYAEAHLEGRGTAFDEVFRFLETKR